MLVLVLAPRWLKTVLLVLVLSVSLVLMLYAMYAFGHHILFLRDIYS